MVEREDDEYEEKDLLTGLAKVNLHLKYIRKEITSLNTKLESIESLLDEKYLQRTEYVPVRNVVYGLVGAILTGVIVAILASIIR